MRRALPLALVAAIALATPAHAYFEFTQAGARGVALGPGSIVIVDDASAYHWNPALLASMARPELLIDYSKPYDVTNLDEGAVAVGGRAFDLGLGAAWHHTGVRGVYGEDQFCLAAARTVFHRASGHLVQLGGTFKYERAAFQSFTDGTTLTAVDFGSLAKGSFDVGAFWGTPWGVDFAYVARDLLEPRFEFIPGTGGQRLTVSQEVAAGFRWNPASTLTMGWSQSAATSSGFNAGLEIRFFDVFAIRSSLSNLGNVYRASASPNDVAFSGGFGVYHNGWRVDAAAETTHDLGASYRVTMRLRGAR